MGIAFDGPRAKMYKAFARALVTRHITSSQAADWLAGCCAGLGITSRKVVQDVKTRWLSTQGLFGRLVYRMDAIKLHERLEDIASLL